jgi:hypothetical protein
VSPGVAIAQNDLDYAEAVDHRNCHLVPALLATNKCGLGQLESDTWSQRFVGHERFLRVHLPAARKSTDCQRTHQITNVHVYAPCLVGSNDANLDIP